MAAAAVPISIYVEEWGREITRSHTNDGGNRRHRNVTSCDDVADDAEINEMIAEEGIMWDCKI